MDALMTTAETAKVLRTCVQTVRRLANTGRLPVVRYSPKDFRFRVSDVDAFIGGGGVSPTLPTLPTESHADPAPSPPTGPAEPPKPKREAKPKELPPAWVTDYDVYRDMVTEAFNALYVDEKWIARQVERHPGYTAAQIKEAIRNAYDDCWITQDKGWPNKIAAYKKSKVGHIDWPATVSRGLVFNLPKKGWAL